MVTLPTSLAMAVLMMVPLGMTFNSGTLIGLLLSIGRLVDDSIIDIHAVERHLRMGKDPKTATIDGIAEVFNVFNRPNWGIGTVESTTTQYLQHVSAQTRTGQFGFRLTF